MISYLTLLKLEFVLQKVVLQILADQSVFRIQDKKAVILCLTCEIKTCHSDFTILAGLHDATLCVCQCRAICCYSAALS